MRAAGRVGQGVGWSVLQANELQVSLASSPPAGWLGQRSAAAYTTDTTCSWI